MVSRRTRVASWIFRRDHPSRPNAMICCFFSSFKTFAMLREATDPPAAVNVLDVSSESMAAFQVFTYGRFWVFTEGHIENDKITFVLSPWHWVETAQTKDLAKACPLAEFIDFISPVWLRDRRDLERTEVEDTFFK